MPVLPEPDRSLQLAKPWCLRAMVVRSAQDTLRGENGATVLLSNLCRPRNLGTLQHNWTPTPNQESKNLSGLLFLFATYLLPRPCTHSPHLKE